MKTVMISIQPQWCELIASGAKTLEVRKTKPKLETPFKVYIYCTKSKPGWFDFGKKERLDGKVIGEFTCDHIYQYTTANCLDGVDITAEEMTAMSCLTHRELEAYEFSAEPKENCIYLIGLYGWHISDLKIYDKPLELSVFTRLRKTKFGLEPVRLERAPQSWCYVEETI